MEVIGFFFALLLTIAAATASSFQGVDPNTLSCDPKGQVFLLLPHFTDCSKFYMCVHGNEEEFSCGPGTLFDFERQVCNHDWATACWLREPPISSEEDIEGKPEEPEVEGSGDPDDLDEAQPTTLNPRANVAPMSFGDTSLNCRDPETANKQIPYRGDCQRYWRCENGLAQTSYCSDGLFFNPVSRQCDYETNVACQTDDELKGGEFIVYKK